MTNIREQRENENVNMIIGSDVSEPHWVVEQRCGGLKEPYAVRAPLGWTLMGPIGTERIPDKFYLEKR